MLLIPSLAQQIPPPGYSSMSLAFRETLENILNWKGQRYALLRTIMNETDIHLV
jgi:hypothetical protein